MAHELFVVKTAGGGLIPATAADAEALDAVEAGQTYRAVLTTARGRSLEQHRLLFAMIKLIIENSPIEPKLTKDTVLAVLKLRSGHVKVASLPSGEVIMFPASIAFEKLPQDRFNVWFEKALDIMCRDFVPNLPVETARREITAIAEGHNRP